MASANEQDNIINGEGGNVSPDNQGKILYPSNHEISMSESSEENKRPRDAKTVTKPLTVYSCYVLILFTVVYLFNQLDRYILGVTNVFTAQEIHYGDMQCFSNKSVATNNTYCNFTSQASCEGANNSSGSDACFWNYNGQGFEYALLAGPIFIVIYTLMGIPLGFLADFTNRKNLFAAAVTFWSLMTVLSGAVTQYWQLALLRFGLGIGEAGCTPFATSLIADYFDISHRAAAIGVYNMGIYMGYSLSYAVGDFITDLNILGQGWRWAYYLSGTPGLLIGPLMFFTVKEPERPVSKENKTSVVTRWQNHARESCGGLCRLSVLVLCLAGSIRNGAGYVWAYYTQPYFTSEGQTPQQVGTYMSWVPLVAGSIGVVLGGFISDRIVKRVGINARLLVIIASQILAAPFAAGALYFDPPWAYISLIPGNIIGEMWIGVALTVLIELVPSSMITLAVAVYIFIIGNIGGNMPLLVTPIHTAFKNAGFSHNDGFSAALYVLYPGLYLVAAALFGLTILAIRWDLACFRHRSGYTEI